jgi:putative ABC transport system permease protein
LSLSLNQQPPTSPPISNTPLWRLAWRRFQQRSIQYFLCVLGVALGVAMLVSIDLANGSAQRAFELSTDAIAGHTTHRIVAVAPSGVEESLYTKLRTKVGFRTAAPVVEGYGMVAELGNQPLRLVGVDLFAETPFREYFVANDTSTGLEGLQAFLTEPNAVVIVQDIAEQYGVKLGDRLTVDVSGHKIQARLVGMLNPENPVTRRALSSLIFADIASAQDMLGMDGHLSHIDLIAQDADLEQIAPILPTGVHFEPAAAKKNAVQQMTAAFRLNLTALSLLALVVGMFLIYNTVTFSVIQRRPLFGTLRCLGATPGQLFTLIMGESAVLSLLGSVIGVGLGIVLARAIVGLITQTINDFYFVVSVQQVTIPQSTLVKGVVIGVVSALFASLVPALEAMKTSPQSILQRSTLESKVRELLPWLVLSWSGLTVIGVGFLKIPQAGIVIAFAGLFTILLGAALLTPPLTVLFVNLLQPLTSRTLGVIGRLAPRDIVRSLSRTSVAIAALIVAVSVIVGVSIMIGSFRGTVIQWLDQTLQADIYITTPSTTANRTLGKLDPQVIQDVQHWPGLQDIVTYNDTDVTVTGLLELGSEGSSRKTVQRQAKLISAGGDVSHGQRPYAWKRYPNTDPWQYLTAGDGVLVSEALVLKEHLDQPPVSITLETPQGEEDFPVVGVFYDYSSDQGTIILDDDRYRDLWQDASIASIGVFTQPDQSVDQVVADLRTHFQGRSDVVIQSNRSLRQDSLEIFDRTFAITQALRLLAVIVAFIGVLSTLMSLQLERTREIGILRAIGMTPAQLWGMTFLETGIMGTVAGLLAMPLGYTLAWILIYVINVRSFGWTLQMQITPSYFWQAAIVAVLAALLAGIYPAWRLGRMIVADAVRQE